VVPLGAQFGPQIRLEANLCAGIRFFVLFLFCFFKRGCSLSFVMPDAIAACSHQVTASWLEISGVEGAAAAAERAAVLAAVLGLLVGLQLVVADDTAQPFVWMRAYPGFSYVVTAIEGTSSYVVARRARAERGRRSSRRSVCRCHLPRELRCTRMARVPVRVVSKY
jgi:hypothetical protein